MKPKIKPRNPFVVLAKFRKAGSHEKPAKSLRRQDKQALAKTAKQSPESWHKCISSECTSAMARIGKAYFRAVSFAHDAAN